MDAASNIERLVALAHDRGVPELAPALTRAPIGLPRPIVDGTPEPFAIGSSDDEVARSNACAHLGLCPVCGDQVAPDEQGRLWAGLECSRSDGPFDTIGEGSFLHRRCLRLAIAHCPGLAEGRPDRYGAWLHESEVAMHRRPHVGAGYDSPMLARPLDHATVEARSEGLYPKRPRRS